MLNGAFIASWAERAADGLRRHREEINELNVFPIPDSDTGSNMTATMDAAVQRMHRDHGQADTSDRHATVAEVASSLAAGAVSGARGNSGLVLSQILRAVADTAAATRRGQLPEKDLVSMLHHAEDLVRRAVSTPVEGTIISVLHAAAESADAAETAEKGIAEVVAAARDAAAQALEATTDQLPELSSAGVVDAGGRGLVVILDALVDALADTPVPEPDADDSDESDDSDDIDDADADSAGPTAEIEVMFTYRAGQDALAELQEQLNRRGNSVVVVPGEDDGSWRVHVHTTEGGPLIELAYGTGEVSDLTLEVLPPATDTGKSAAPTAPVLALAPEGGLREMFSGAGATSGDTDMIVHELAERQTGCIVLTNGQETNELFGRLSSSGGEATVVDTESFVGGLAALAVYSPSADLDENAEEMADAVSAQRWRETDGDAADLRAVTEDLLGDGGELVTVLFDDTRDGVDADDVASALDALRGEYRDVELHSYRVPGLGTSAQVGVE